MPVLLAWPCQLLTKSRLHRALLGRRDRSGERLPRLLSPAQLLSQSQAEARVQTSMAFSLGGINV